ncbi:Solute carrier family 26 member 6 [Bagarius yarrelli]|uniref:Solute carrier family 26 member 6 n=1 Tax=Bagarius yarrelli TaxID=175774 RepID=A0A556UFI3_BAGYA|nr:Solute carrier family 26 member 6 [Bagarius yarrelli]
MEAELNERNSVKQRVGYHIRREVMDELKVDKLAEKSDVHTSLREKIKESMRCSGPRVKNCFLSCVPLLSWLPRYPFKENAFGDLISGISVGIMHLPQGTYAVMSVMIGSVTERMAPDSDFMIINSTYNSSTIDLVARDNERVKIAAAVTFLSGIFQLLLGLVQFGFVVTYLSEPLVRGYTTAAAIHVLVSQLKYTFGISTNRYSGPLSLIYTVLDVCSLLGETNIGTLVVSIVTILCLIIAKEVNTFLARRLPVPIPVELFAIILATVLSWQFDFKTMYNVDVVGSIPSGLQAPVLPAFSKMGSMIGDAFALAVVGYGIAISLGRIFALKYGYKELIALGLSNTVGGVFQCFAISCSMSRTMVQISTGGKTQAVLAAIIYVNLHGMMKQFTDIRTLWRSNRVDMLVWVMTFILTILLNPDMGLAASIAFSMLTVIFRTQLPSYSLLGRIPGTDIYKPIEDYNQVTQIPGLVIFRCSATLYFANAEMYTEHLYEKSGVDVPKLLSHKKKLEAKRLRAEKKEAKRVKKQVKKEAAEMSDEEDRYKVAVVMSPELYQSPDPTIPKALILDLSPVNFLDTVGVKTLRNIHKDFGDAEIKVLLSGCQRCVTDSLEKGNFFNDKITKAILFSTVHDAVLHCQGEYTQEV